MAKFVILIATKLARSDGACLKVVGVNIRRQRDRTGKDERRFIGTVQQQAGLPSFVRAGGMTGFRRGRAKYSGLKNAALRSKL